jgi:hypothetical protein
MRKAMEMGHEGLRSGRICLWLVMILNTLPAGALRVPPLLGAGAWRG